jgi:hypothetical protein
MSKLSTNLTDIFVWASIVETDINLDNFTHITTLSLALQIVETDINLDNFTDFRVTTHGLKSTQAFWSFISLIIKRNAILLKKIIFQNYL